MHRIRVSDDALPRVARRRAARARRREQTVPQLSDDLAVRSAALMYAGAAVLGLVENFVPGTPRSPIVPGVVALSIMAVLLLAGRRIPRAALFLFAPIGVALIAYAVGETTRGYGDGAVLYAWPVVWTAHFFDRRATAAVVATVGVAHVLALEAMPAGVGYASRWIDVMVSMTLVALVVRALTERNQRLVDSLAQEARIDPVTGLFNRRGLAERADLELERSRRDTRPLSLLAFDIDRFKAINDSRGHDVGDELLGRIGAALLAEIRAIDTAARVGGDELVILLPGTDAFDAYAVAERVRAVAARAARAIGCTVTLSAGVASATAPDELGTLVKVSDQALYRAKREGRNRTVVASPPVEAIA